MSVFAFLRRRRALPRAPELAHSLISWDRGGVRAAVVRISQGSAELLGVGQAAAKGLDPRAQPDVDRLASACEQALSAAEELTASQGRRKIVPDDATFSVPAEIVRCVPVVVQQRRREPDRGVTSEELQTALQRGYRQVQDGLGAPLRVDQDVVYGAVAETLLDGKPAHDPLGLRGYDLELHLTFGLLPVTWIRALEVAADRLRLNISAMVPVQAALAASLRENSALLMLASEWHTSLSLVREGMLAWSALVEMGERTVAGEVARAMDLQPRQTDALFSAYREGELKPEVEEQVARAFWHALRRWLQALAERLEEGLPEREVPHAIYFVDLTGRFPEAEPSLRTPFWEQSLPFTRCPEVIRYSANTVRDVLDYTTQAVGTAFLPLRALAHHAARLYASDDNLERSLAALIRWRPPGGLHSR